MADKVGICWRCASTRDGEFVVVWNDGRYIDVIPTGPFDIFARRFDTSGAALAERVQINERQAMEDEGIGRGALAVDANGAFVVAWGSANDNYRPTAYSVYARQVSSDGEPFGSERYLGSSSNILARNPVVAVSAAGETSFVAWNTGFVSSDARILASVEQIICADVDQSGSLTVTDALLVLRSAVGLVFCARVLCDTDGNGLVAASDALITLQAVVGLPADLDCPVN